MSYSNIKNLEEIINKKVLFYDLETTGLVKTQKGIKPEEQYPDYKDLEKYNNARIVSIGWLYLEEFDYDYEIGIENISEKIIKPQGFKIPDDAIKIHGITNEKAKKEGIKLRESLKKFGKIIKKCEYIIGYNVYYDINVLLSELHRKKRTKTIEKILKLKKEEKIICLGQISSKVIPPNKFIKYNKYAIPKQTDVYKKCYNEELLNAHDAKSDVLGMIKIMFWIYENTNKINLESGISYFEENIAKNIKEVDKLNIDEINNQNYGQKWFDKEYELLLNEIDENKTISEICVEHGRNLGGIKGGIKRLITKHPNNQKIKNYYKNTFETTNNNNDVNNNNDINNKKGIKENFPNIGKKWSDDEYNLLKNEINNKMSLEEICKNHERYKGGIKKAIKRLIDNKEIKFNDELKNKYSIKSYQIIDNDENLDDYIYDNKESYEEIISILVEKIENLKNENKILKEKNTILKSKTNYIKLSDDELENF